MRHGLTIVVGVMCLSAGFLLGSAERPVPVDSELATAQVLSGDREVRLIGFQCGDHNLTAVARYEDEFPEQGCREIRVLRSDAEFLAPPPLTLPYIFADLAEARDEAVVTSGCTTVARVPDGWSLGRCE